MLAEDAKIRVERRFQETEAWALADGDKIKQVFWNFAENAVRAMQKEGGKLTVSLVERDSDWEISFADTGPGIHPQQTEKIFEPFQSNFEGGTGLGLAIVYQIVQAHEGKVWARSEVGKGTSFVLRLRRMDRTESETAPDDSKISDAAGESRSVEAAIASLGGANRG